MAETNMGPPPENPWRKSHPPCIWHRLLVADSRSLGRIRHPHGDELALQLRKRCVRSGLHSHLCSEGDSRNRFEPFQAISLMTLILIRS